MKWMTVLFVVTILSLPAVAQTSGKADVFSAAQIKALLATLGTQAAAAGSAGTTLADYGSHKVQLSVRTASGGAEIHAHFDDVMIVEQGSATLIIGGTVLGAQSNSDGETHGISIQGGQSRAISVGDVVTVNAGVPHQLIVPAGTTYSAIVIKVRE